MKTDKQLLALNKTDLLKEYRELEHKLEEVSANTSKPTLEEAIKIIKDHNMIVREKQHYNF